MFDLIAGREKHLPSHATVPLLLSTLAQGTVIALVALLPFLYVTERLPEVPTMMAFVAELPAPPPPPPPPPVAAKAKSEPPKAAAAPEENQFVAPVEEPAQISELPDDEGFVGVPGGVEGGLAEGTVGGIVGGLPEAPPPPPPAPVHKTPVRIGGQIKPPQLLKRIEPEYPPLAVAASIQGVVILEATVNEDGAVTDVRILRSVHALLDREADRVVRQWRYSPVVLNDIRVPFILTVTLSFALEAPK